MWKSHFTVETKGIVFHKGCENLCGNLQYSVGIFSVQKVFHTKSLTKNRTVENFPPEIDLTNCKDCP